RLIGLAVKMCYAGLGDYWEDVDQYVRNHAVEYQFTAKSVLRQLGKADVKVDEYYLPDEVLKKLDVQNLRWTPDEDLKKLDAKNARLPSAPPGMAPADVIRSAIGDIGTSQAMDGSYE